jgi:hypothetical protein
MANMWWDGKFSLIRDGDRYERLWWPLLEGHFPQWERFWLHHVVPLTNRIDRSIGAKDRRKQYLRDDPEIDSDAEAMVMANYSVFYYLGRASVIILTEPHLFAEDAFMLLRAATENVANFLTTVGRLAPKLDIAPDALPSWPALQADETVSAIKAYREAFVHWPRLGRNPHMDWESVPRRRYLNRARSSWAYVQKLGPECFEDSREYLQKVRIELMQVLDPEWGRITAALDACRSGEAYLRCYRLRPSGEVLPRGQAGAP